MGTPLEGVLAGAGPRPIPALVAALLPDSQPQTASPHGLQDCPLPSCLPHFAQCLQTPTTSPPLRSRVYASANNSVLPLKQIKKHLC